MAGKGRLVLTTWSWLICFHWRSRKCCEIGDSLNCKKKKTLIKCLQYFKCLFLICGFCNGLFPPVYAAFLPVLKVFQFSSHASRNFFYPLYNIFQSEFSGGQGYAENGLISDVLGILQAIFCMVDYRLLWRDFCLQTAVKNFVITPPEVNILKSEAV